MVKEPAEYVYFKKTVPYYISVRMFPTDAQAKLLTAYDPVVAVDRLTLREFRLANKKAITEGLIIEIAEPSMDWETPNTITDEDITDILKNYFKLKARIVSMDSVAILQKILATAKELNKSQKITNLIEERITELDDTVVEDPSQMQGVV